MPTAAYLVECKRPFDAPPKTYGEAVERDQIWLCAYERCAAKIAGTRKELNLSYSDDWLCGITLDDKKPLTKL